ncbi:prokaryotic E2 ligase family D protein [Oscillospiraceae bacterium OttesenSCG-928-F05]|nr:prokaryotic E2 ligase family D protein [Oscillospiraceae bacterium OttesenSCG-928-F05]
MNETRIILREAEEFIKVEHHSGGTVRVKQICAGDLTECIKHAYRNIVYTSGLLPANCLAVNHFEQNEKSLVIRHSERYADITYFDTLYEHFPVPQLLFGFRVTASGRIMSSYIAVVGPEKTLRPESSLYVYPFSNVYSNFRVCTGSNTFPEAKSLHTLGSIPYYILGMPNNMDHYDRTKNRQGWEMRELLERVKDKPPEYYYSDVLIESGKSLSDFLKEVAS